MNEEEYKRYKKYKYLKENKPQEFIKISDEDFEDYKRINRINNFNIKDFNFGETMPRRIKVKFQELLTKYKAVWTNKTEFIGCLKNYQCKIKVTSEQIIRSKPYKQSIQQQKLLDAINLELMQARVIRPSISPYSCPSMLVPRVTGDEHLGIQEKKKNKNLKNKY